MATPTDPIPPGFLTVRGAEMINSALMLGEGNRRRLDAIGAPPDGEMNVKIVGFDTASSYFTWTQQFFTVGGGYTDAPSGFSGNATQHPLVERNGFLLSAFPYYASVRPRGAIGTLGMLYEFSENQAGAGIEFALVTALSNASGVQTSVTVIGHWGGPSPGSHVTVNNLTASSGFVYSGTSGNHGIALWDNVAGIWRIVQIQC